MDASVASPVHTTKGLALQKVTLLHYQTQVFMIWMQAQTSALVWWSWGDRKRCTSVQSPFSPPKNRKVLQRSKNSQIFSKASCLDSFLKLLLYWTKMCQTHSYYVKNWKKSYWAENQKCSKMVATLLIRVKFNFFQYF